VFCHSSGLKHLESLDTSEIGQRLVEARDLGAESVLFSGGEPTMRKDLVELASHCRDLGLGFGLITNGRMLSYEPLTRKLAGLGLDYVYLSLHGSGEVHDAITRSPGSFEQSLGALVALSKIGGIRLASNAVVTRWNLEELNYLVSLLAPMPGVSIKFSYVEPKGAAVEDDSIIPEPTVAARQVSRAIDYGLELSVPLSRFGVDGFPHCLDSRFGALQDDLFTHRVIALREVAEDFHAVDYGNMRKPQLCSGCLISDECRCTWAGALDRFGTDFLVPVRGGLANSYNYFPLEEPPDGLDESRLITVRVEEGLVCCATDTRDFSPAQLRDIRDRGEQVYLQVDESEYVTDFPVQLRKLAREVRPDSAAGPVFARVEEDLFSSADECVTETLSGLSGSVLDVGCGQTRYGALLEKKIVDGEIAYWALDPEPGENALRLAAQERGRVSLLRTAIEDAALAKGSFDWVLVLRSHNHLHDLWTAYCKIIGALKWGGHLLVVDNVAFGLVRLLVARETVESLVPEDGAGQEHLRNHGAAEAAAFLSRFPLVEVGRVSVSPSTANQWLLHYRKLWPAGKVGKDTFPGA